MSSISVFLAELKTAGITVTTEGEELKIKSRVSPIPPNLIKQLKEKKPALMVFFQELDNADTEIQWKNASQREKQQGFPISSLQKSLWSIYKLISNPEIYNVQSVFKIEGKLDLKRLKSALKKVYLIHDSLHSRFVDKGDQVLMRSAPDPLWQVEEQTIQEHELPEWLELEKNRHFDLQQGPVLIARLLKINQARRFLQLNFPHILIDGWSIQLLWKEVVNYYSDDNLSCRDDNNVDNEEREVTGFIDYLAQEKQEKENHQYWLQELAGIEPVQLHSMSEITEDAQFLWRTTLPVEQSKQLRSLSRGSEVSEFVTSMSIFAVLMSRYLDRSDIVISTPYASRANSQLESVIGYTVSMLPVRMKFTGDLPVCSQLQSINKTLHRGMASAEFDMHALLSALNLQTHDLHNPLQHLVFAWQEGVIGVENLPATEITRIPVSQSGTKFPLMLSMFPDGDSYQMNWEFDPAQISVKTITQLQHLYTAILAGLSQSIESCLSKLALSSQLIAKPYQPAGNIIDVFKQVVERVGNKSALSYGTQVWSYRQLDEYSNKVAACLQYQGVQNGSIVGVSIERSPEQVIAILGILKTGAAYLPFTQELTETQWQTTQTQFKQKQTAMAACLYDDKLVYDKVVHDKIFHDAVPVINIKDAIGWTSSTISNVTLTPENPAYVNFPSKNTEQEKGVVCLHRGVVRLVCKEDYMQLDETTVMLSSSPASSDPFTLQLWGPLLNGGQVLLAGETELNTQELNQSINTSGVNAAWLTATAFNTLVDSDTFAFKGLQQLLLGGSVVSPLHVNKLYRSCPELTIINAYGQTENTALTSYFPIPIDWPKNKPVPIGKAINGTQIYIIDSQGLLQPKGFAGEIVVAGLGLAKYDPGSLDTYPGKFTSLTSNGEQQTVYRTGDLGYFDLDDNLHLIGETDNQIKINGINIRLEQIDYVLRQHGWVATTETLAIDVNGQLLLVSFVTLNGAPGPYWQENLSGFAATSLPDYMQPSMYIPLDKIPVTINGKLDHQALTNLFDKHQAKTCEQRPLNETEQTIATAWKEILGCENLSPSANFYRLGGNSLLVLRSQHLLAKAFECNLPMKLVMKHKILSELAEAIKAETKMKPGTKRKAETEIQHKPENTGQSESTTQSENITQFEIETRGKAEIVTTPRIGAPLIPEKKSSAGNNNEHSGKCYPLSMEQLRLWTIHQLDPSSAYNIPLFIELPIAINEKLLEQAIYSVLQIHPILRMKFVERDGEILQEAVSLKDWSLIVEHLAADELEGRMSLESQRVFDLSDGLPCYVSLLHLINSPREIRDTPSNTQRKILLFNIHHLCFDGESLAVFIKALDLALKGRQTIPANQFDSFVQWQKGSDYQETSQAAITYWQKRLAGFCENTELPPDLSRSRAQNTASSLSFPVPDTLSTKARQIARDSGISEFSFWFGLFHITLARISQKSDLVIAIPVANRINPEFQEIIGFLANTLLLRFQLNESEPFTKMLTDLHSHIIEDICYQTASIDQVVKALDASGNAGKMPLTQVMFSLFYQQPMTLMGEPISLHSGANSSAKYDLNLATSIKDNSVKWRVEYNTGCFSDGLIRSFLDAMQVVLEQICDNSEIKIGDLALTNAPVVSSSSEQNQAPLIPALIEAQTHSQPDSPALATATISLNYRELYQRALGIAAAMQYQGVKAQDRVAVLMHRDADLPVTLLAILLSRAIYVPLDPAYPEGRTRYIIEDAQPNLLLVNDPALLDNEFADVAVFTLERLLSEARDQQLSNLEINSRARADLQPNDLAYIIYTSGSTGRPKGVPIRHESVAYLYQWASQTYAKADFSLTYAGTSICFDLSIFELFVTWGMGGTVYFAENQLALLDDASTLPVSLINTVPSVLSEILKYADLPASTRVVNLAGEPLPLSLVHSIAKHTNTDTDINTDTSTVTNTDVNTEQCNKIKLFNLYGPSEDTTYSTAYQIDMGNATRVMIGKPINGTQAAVMDARGRPLPKYFPGELYLSGNGLSQGYWGNSELTAKSFVGSATFSARSYRTGDRVRIVDGDNIDFIGRIDNQVKLRGFRIELGEVDACLLTLPGVTEACSVVNKAGEDDAQLVSFITFGQQRLDETGIDIEKPVKQTSDKQDIDKEAPDSQNSGKLEFNEETLREELTQFLPAYMVPSRIVLLTEIPLTPSGKQDRKTLANSVPELEVGDTGAPTDEYQNWSLNLFRELLSAPAVSLDSPYLAIGGNSLFAATVLAKVKSDYDVRLTFQDFFENNTARLLAGLIKNKIEGNEIVPSNIMII